MRKNLILALVAAVVVTVNPVAEELIILDDTPVGSAWLGDHVWQSSELEAAWELGVSRVYTGGYGEEDTALFGGCIDLGRPVGVMAARWAIRDTSRTWDTVHATDISRYGMDWLPALAPEVYVDLAWSTSQVRSIAQTAASVLEDLYTLDGWDNGIPSRPETQTFRTLPLMVRGLVREYRNLESELAEMLEIRTQILAFAGEVLASGGVNNPIQFGRPYYPAMYWPVCEGSVSRDSLDAFIIQEFGEDCIPRATEDMPWYVPTPTPVAPTPVAPVEPTVEPGTPAPAQVDLEPTADFTSTDLILEEFTDWEDLDGEELFSDGSEWEDFESEPAQEDLIILD